MLCGLADNIPYRESWAGLAIAECDRIIVQANGGIYIGEYRGES